MGDDAAVTEVIGFVLMFALSSIILVISVQSFSAAKEDSEAVLAAAELKAVATRVSSRLVQAGLVSQDFPDATFEVTLDLPRQVAGYEYRVSISPTAVDIVSLDGTVTASSSTFRLDAYTQSDPCFAVRGSAVSSYGRVRVAYYTDTEDGAARPAGCASPTAYQIIELEGVA